MSEDCLFLNVWTPAKRADEKLPVMVFIHGGAFVEGAGSLPRYEGSELAKKGVVVVTLNYRLGALGFMAHPLLASESAHNSSGNYGLQDQQAALQWVQKNIGAFSGDPTRVTVFGESAGATSVLSQLSSPQGKGLFRQAIVESPVPLIIGTNADEGTTLAARTGMNVTAYETYIRNHFGPDAGTVLAKYPATTPAEVQHQMERIMTDFDFSDAAKFAAGSMAGLNQSTYLYRFTYPMPGQPLGAFHGSELYFIFRPASMKPDPVSSRVSDTMMDYWTQFAKTDNPDGGMNVTWPQYTKENGKYLDIGETPVVKTGY